jgi:hypothetical protein
MMQHVSFSPNLFTTALTVLLNVSRDLSAGWLACKNCNESKTPHICWLQSYLEYEFRVPDFSIPQSPSYYSKLISRRRNSQKASNGNQRQLHWPQNEIHNIRGCRSVRKNKIIIGFMDLKIKIVCSRLGLGLCLSWHWLGVTMSWAGGIIANPLSLNSRRY